MLSHISISGQRELIIRVLPSVMGRVLFNVRCTSLFQYTSDFAAPVHPPTTHIAVQRGLQHLAGPEVVENTHISIASLLNCSAALHNGVSVFMRSFLVLEPRGALPQGAVSEFWERLDVPPALLSLFVVADPVWDESRQLCVVDASLQSDEECWDKARLLIMTCRRLSQWSDTRCARFGRLFVRSLATGIDAAVKACFDDDSCSNYLLIGYRRAPPEVRMLVAVATFAVTPFGDFILEMLSGDRLLRRSEELHGRVAHGGCLSDGPIGV